VPVSVSVSVGAVRGFNPFVLQKRFRPAPPGALLIPGASGETAFCWPRPSVDLQESALRTRPASGWPALAPGRTTPSDPQLPWRGGSFGRRPAAPGLRGSAGAAVFSPAARDRNVNSRGRPSVVWVGVGSGHPHLFALHRRIQDALLSVGLEPDLKPFHPHVTVGRANGISHSALQPFVRRHADTDFDLIKVSGFELYSSVLRAAGATHRVEMRQEFCQD
jgi:LigT like Phosphoesterase